jgi:superfamily II helicase
MMMDSTALYHKCKNTKIKEIYEIILQWYLISTGYRNVALVYVKSKSKLEKIMKFLKKNNISYRIFDTDLVLFNPKKFNIDELDTSKIKNFGRKLGDFYTCATNDVSKNHYRVVISVSKPDSDNIVEIFAQMCKKNMIHKNIAKFYEIYLEIMEIFGKLDKKLFCKLETYKNPRG